MVPSPWQQTVDPRYMIPATYQNRRKDPAAEQGLARALQANARSRGQDAQTFVSTGQKQSDVKINAARTRAEENDDWTHGIYYQH
jgi:hypothetical protein